MNAMRTLAWVVVAIAFFVSSAIYENVFLLLASCFSAMVAQDMIYTRKEE